MKPIRLEIGDGAGVSFTDVEKRLQPCRRVILQPGDSARGLDGDVLANRNQRGNFVLLDVKQAIQLCNVQ